MEKRITPYGSILDHDQCIWCYTDFSKRKKYAFGLCLTCYRWFRRYLNKEIIRCSLCDRPIKKYQGMLCLPCKERIGTVGRATKRKENIRNKVINLVPQFEQLETEEEARDEFDLYFNAKQTKFLDILLERYFDATPLREIGERYNCTREYIRQCETTALDIISENIDLT